MKNWKVFAAVAALALFLLLSFTACGAKDEESAPSEVETVYTNGGMKLTIPEEYAALLLVETPENDADGILFAVAEKASVEAAGGDGYGAGELFRIGVVSEDALREMLRGDLSGVEPFASDADGMHYIYYHPTDVRFTRGSVEQMREDQAQWDALNEWAWASVRDAFVSENGLTPETLGSGEDYSGAWQDEISQRASMDVTRSDDGGYTLLVHWGSGASEASVWEIAGSFDESGTLTYEDGKYTVHTFDENGGETVSEEETTRGSFTQEDGKLRWQDSKNDGEGLFVKID